MHTASILLIENDLSLQTSLIQLFDRQLWTTKAVTSLEQAWRALDSQTFTLLVIDRVLDDGDGLEIVEYLRSIQHPSMLLCLTAKGEVMERLRGLKTGADEYLPKPFSSEELVLRIKNLLAKRKLYQPTKFICDSFTFDPETGHVGTPSDNFYLRRRESQILGCLFRHQKSVVTRRMLVDTLWPGATTVPEESTLDVYVRRLRMSLGEHGKAIKTVRGFGYMLKP